jgi:hypothetical protein
LSPVKYSGIEYGGLAANTLGNNLFQWSLCVLQRRCVPDPVSPAQMARIADEAGSFR